MVADTVVADTVVAADTAVVADIAVVEDTVGTAVVGTAVVGIAVVASKGAGCYKLDMSAAHIVLENLSRAGEGRKKDLCHSAHNGVPLHMTPLLVPHHYFRTCSYLMNQFFFYC